MRTEQTITGAIGLLLADILGGVGDGTDMFAIVLCTWRWPEHVNWVYRSGLALERAVVLSYCDADTNRTVWVRRYMLQETTEQIRRCSYVQQTETTEA